MTLYLHDQFTGIKIVFILFSKVLFICTWTTKTWYHKCILKRFSSLRPCFCCCVALCQFMLWHVSWAHRIYTFRMRSKRKAVMNLWNNTQGCSNTNITTVSNCVDYECVRPLYALTRNIEFTNIILEVPMLNMCQYWWFLKIYIYIEFLCENPWHSCYSVISRRYKKGRIVSPSSSKYFSNSILTCD